MNPGLSQSAAVLMSEEAARAGSQYPRGGDSNASATLFHKAFLETSGAVNTARGS